MRCPFLLYSFSLIFFVLKRKEKNMSKKEVPIWEKSNLTLEEASVYFNIGINRLRVLTDKKDCNFVLYVGSKRLIKRKQLDDYLQHVSYI